MLRSYKKKAWPLSPRFQVLAWLVHQITALLYILPWKTPGSQETQQHPARSPASAPRLLTGDGDCALVCWSSSSPQRHESGDWALTWRTLLDCLDRTFRLFPLSIATWTLWGGQLTSFLGSTLWLRRPFFALGSWVTFSCGHYKSSILLFGTLGNTSVLRILVVDPQVEGSPSIHSAATCFVIAVDQWWKSLWTCRAEQRTYSSHRLGQAPGRFYPLTSLHWGAYLCRALYRCLYERERRCQNLFMTVRHVYGGFCIENAESSGPSYRDITHLFVTGGRDTGLCLFLTSVLILGLPEPAFTEEPLV